MNRLRPALVVVGILVALVGCGIPTDDEPRPLADEPTTTTTLVGGGDSAATVYLVGASNQLERRSRPLVGTKSPQTVLDALLLPPTDEEADDGLTSLIPPDTTALEVVQDDGLVTADMSVEWQRLADPTATTAYAQVVLTLTDLPGVERVRFLIDGQETAAPTVAQGQQPVVEADDYAALDPDG